MKDICRPMYIYILLLSVLRCILYSNHYHCCETKLFVELRKRFADGANLGSDEMLVALGEFGLRSTRLVVELWAMQKDKEGIMCEIPSSTGSILFQTT